MEEQFNMGDGGSVVVTHTPPGEPLTVWEVRVAFGNLTPSPRNFSLNSFFQYSVYVSLVDYKLPTFSFTFFEGLTDVYQCKYS